MDNRIDIINKLIAVKDSKTFKFRTLQKKSLPYIENSITVNFQVIQYISKITQITFTQKPMLEYLI